MTGFDAELDARGLQCPLPVLKARKRLRSMRAGQSLRILATDPMAAIDFPHYCRESGHDLLALTQEDGMFIVHIRKSRAG